MATATKLLPMTLTRRMREGDAIPTHLGESFLNMPRLDRDWIWLAEHDDHIVGCIIAAPCHGLALILRVKMSDDAPRTALLALLRKFFDDVRARGFIGYLSWFDESSDSESTLRTIAEKLGGLVIERPGVAVASWLPPEGT